MREIALDTETTGINPQDGHRIIEIGALELMHHLPTGRKLHLCRGKSGEKAKRIATSYQ